MIHGKIQWKTKTNITTGTLFLEHNTDGSTYRCFQGHFGCQTVPCTAKESLWRFWSELRSSVLNSVGPRWLLFTCFYFSGWLCYFRLCVLDCWSKHGQACMGHRFASSWLAWNEINVNGQMHGEGYVPLWHRMGEEGCRLFSFDILHGNVLEAGGLDAIT